MKSVMNFNVTCQDFQNEKIQLKFPADSKFSGYSFYLPLSICKVDKRRPDYFSAVCEKFTMFLCMNDQGDCINLTFDQICYEMMRGENNG